MADENKTRNGDHRMTFAERLAGPIDPDRGSGESPERERELPFWIGNDPTGQGQEARRRVDIPARTVAQSAGPALALRDGLVAAEEHARLLAGEIERIQADLGLALAEAVADTERQARSWARRLAPLRGGLLPIRLVVPLVLVLAAAAVAWPAGLLFTPKLENLVLDSGFEAPTTRWSPAGLESAVSQVPNVGRGSSAALQVRTSGATDGEGAAYFEAAGIRATGPHTFSVFARSRGSAMVYAEIRWRASDGSTLSASRGDLTFLDESWRRVVVSGVAPERTATALLVVGEAAGTSAQVTYLLDDAQLEHTATAGSYIATGDQAGGRPSHPTDIAALLMLVAAGVLAFASLRSAVLVALPLSLAIPPSFANIESHLPDITPTRALVIACLLVAAAQRQLRAPPRWMLALGIAYSATVLLTLVSDPSLVSMRLALSLTIGAFAPALLVLAVARARRDLWILACSLAVTAGIVAALALAEWFFGRHLVPLFPGVVFEALERSNHLRARATFPHPIVLGTFLALGMQVTLGLLLAARGLQRVALGAAAVVMAAGLAVTLSRAPWLGAIAGAAALAGLSGIWRRWKMIAAVASILAALVASPIGAPVRDAAEGLVRPETDQERYVVQVRIDLAKRVGSHGARSLLGSSLDPAERPTFPAVIEGRKVDLGDAIDNTYVRELAQTGLLGLLALLALLIGLTTATVRGALRERSNLRFLACGIAASQVVVLVVGLTVGTTSFSQIGAAFWLVAGAGIAIGRAADLR